MAETTGTSRRPRLRSSPRTSVAAGKTETMRSGTGAQLRGGSAGAGILVAELLELACWGLRAPGSRPAVAAVVRRRRLAAALVGRGRTAAATATAAAVVGAAAAVGAASA